MTPLFSEAGYAALRRFLVKPALCLFDFDGTLAPLVSDPARVKLQPSIQLQLQAIQSRAPVGIITGRSLADIRERMGFEPDYVVGNHGLEGLPGWQSRAPLNSELCRIWLSSLQSTLAPFGDAIWIEDKSFSLTVHFRHAQDQHSVTESLSACFAKLRPLPRIIPGKFNVSLLPPNAGDKGCAVEQLLRLSRQYRALYVGDDITDEDVFALRHPDIFPVRVGADVTTAADYVIKNHEDITQLLDWLLMLLPESSPTELVPRSLSRQ